jgi:flagellar biosynthesis component FlhA
MSANPVFSSEAYLEDPLCADDFDDILKEDVSIHFGDVSEEEFDEQEPEESVEVPLAKRVTRSIYADESDTPPSERDQEILFKELMKEHQKRLYRFVIRYIDQAEDAADITQQAFAEAARTIQCFRGDSKLSTWLYGIAMNMVRNYIRKMIEQDLYELPVLSYQELTQDINIQPLARVELG